MHAGRAIQANAKGSDSCSATLARNVCLGLSGHSHGRYQGLYRTAVHSLYLCCWTALVLPCRQYAVSYTFRRNASYAFVKRTGLIRSDTKQLGMLVLLPLVCALHTFQVPEGYRHAFSSAFEIPYLFCKPRMCCQKCEYSQANCGLPSSHLCCCNAQLWRK